MAPEDGRSYCTVAEAARLLSVNPSTVWRWIEAERLPAYRVGPKSIRIMKQDLNGVVRPAKAKRPPSGTGKFVPRPVSEEDLARRRTESVLLRSLRRT